MNYLRYFVAGIRSNWPLTLFFLTILFILLVNTFHDFYPDEFDNLVGGYFITQGRLPYTGFFTHHNPFAYFYAAILTVFSGQSFVIFRVLLAFSFFGLLLGFFFYFKKNFEDKFIPLLLTFYLFVSVGATYLWAHMLLADSLVGYLVLPVYIILFLRIFQNQFLTNRDFIVISILSALTFLTSLTYLYALIVIYLAVIFWHLYKRREYFSKNNFRILFILGAPYLVFAFYLLVTWSWQDFYYQSIFFNREYYITMPDGTPVRNPIRYALVIFDNFYDHYRASVNLAKDFNFGEPFGNTMALSNFFLVIYLFINKRFNLGILVMLLMVYLNGRSDPYETRETDYHIIPYAFFSLFNGLFLLQTIWSDLKTRVEDNKKFIYGFMLLVLGAYFIFAFMFLFSKAFEKGFLKFMGQQALIYDRPAIAPPLNKLIGPDDYYYMGPFAFEDYFYMKNGKMASRYFITIPAMDKSEKIKNELVNDLRTNRPKVIIFDTEYAIFGGYPGKFIYDILQNDYFTLEQLRNGGWTFVSTNKFYNNYDIDRHFFFDKNRQTEIIDQLVKEHLIYDLKAKE